MKNAWTEKVEAQAAEIDRLRADYKTVKGLLRAACAENERLKAEVKRLK